MLRMCSWTIVTIALLWPSAVHSAGESKPAPPAATEPQAPAQVRELLTLLADPAVREWLERRNAAGLAAAPAVAAEDNAVSTYLSTRIEAIRQHVASLAAAFPGLPAELERAARLFRADIRQPGAVLLLLLSFVALGFGAEWMFRRVRRRLDELPLATVGERLRTVATRFAYGTGLLAAFAVGSIAAFLAFDWPPLLRAVVLGYLLAFIVVRLAFIVGGFLFAPNAERFRIVPMETAAAWFWRWRLGVFVGWFAFGWVTIGLLGTLGASPDARRIVAYALGLGLLAIALEAVWRRPSAARDGVRGLGRGAQNAALSLAAVLLWGLWVAGAMPAFWLLLLVVSLPPAIGVTQRSVNHILRPPGAAKADDEVPSVLIVSLERGVRALLIVGAAALLAWAWGLSHFTLVAQDTPFIRLARGALSAVIIALFADVVWHMMKAAIDRKLAEARDPGQPDTDDARRRARLRTLLPILKNLLFVVVIATAGMMALSALGVEIGPLVAGAGVIGVAIGFGAQTLVKDVISGMFYLLDDAFRVGEYIQSGTYKGTVESFSLRSVKLRHHRGPLYTVPFGTLGAVQNMSRDWVIDKLTVGVTYDTDLDKARKLVKQIGKELAEDPEFAPNVIEPLKMQGVEQFGDFAIQIRMKVMTKPNEQFVIRRRAYAMIKRAFDANGIKFAFPTVQIAGEGEPSVAAVAQHGLQLVKPAPTDA